MDTSFFPYITGAGGALFVLCVVAWAFYAGKLHSDREFSRLEAENGHLKTENDQLREALRTERRTSDEIASTAQVANKLMSALVTLALERQPGNLKPEELGL